MKVGWIEQKFCIWTRSVKLGAARPCAARHYTTFPSGCQQAIYTKISFVFGENIFGKNAQKSRSIERDFVGFAYRHFDGFGFSLAVKSVISDKLAYALILPSLAGFVLIPQSIVLGERE